MKQIRMMTVEEYEKHYGDVNDIGVKYVYDGIYTNDGFGFGSGVEYTEIIGYEFEDGSCMIVGCGMDTRCTRNDMIEYLYANLNDVEKMYE